MKENNNPTNKESEADDNGFEDDEELTTVQFDVGGTVYRVSRSLIERYPKTLMARKISRTWQLNPKASIFIDRNGDRFQYVLDYMRDGEVHLPLSVPKESFILDLEYFGFVDIDPQSIHDGYGSVEAVKQIARCEALYQQELEKCHRTVRMFQKKITYLNVAHACFLSYTRSGILSELYLGDYSLNLMTLKDDINSAFDSFNKELFDECLQIHGLKYISHRPIELRTYNTIWYYVSLNSLQATTPLL